MGKSTVQRRSSSRPRSNSSPNLPKSDYRPLVYSLKRENHALYRQKEILSNTVKGLAAAIVVLFLFLLTRPPTPGSTSPRISNWEDARGNILDAISNNVLHGHEQIYYVQKKFPFLPDPYDNRTVADIGFVFANPWEVLSLKPQETNASWTCPPKDVKKWATYLEKRWHNDKYQAHLCSSETGVGFHEDVCVLARQRFAAAGLEVASQLQHRIEEQKRLHRNSSESSIQWLRGSIFNIWS